MTKAKPHPDLKLTLRECFDKYYDKEGMSPRTLAKYHWDLKRWERLTGNPPLGKIDNDLVAKYRAACIAEGLSAETIRTSWSQFRAILRCMAVPALGNPRGRGVIAAVPYFKPVPVIRERPRRISIEELNKAYFACEFAMYPRLGIDPADWWRAFLAVAYFTGLRKGDILRLKRSQIDLQAGTLTFTAGKTQKADTFPPHPVAIEHLRRIWLPERDRLFRGMQPVGSHFYKQWQLILSKADVSHFTIHDIRRTAASEIERVRPGMAAVLLQHAPRDVTGRNYLNLTEELHEAIQGMRVPETFEHGPRIAGEINGKLHQMRLAAAAEYLAPPPRGTVPEDWQFQLGAFRFRGRWFRCSGNRIRVLRSMAMSTVPLDGRLLASVIYGPGIDALDDEVQLRMKQEMHRLRKFLRHRLQLPERWDPVPLVDRLNGAYSLCMPPAELMGGAS